MADPALAAGLLLVCIDSYALAAAFSGGAVTPAVAAGTAVLSVLIGMYFLNNTRTPQPPAVVPPPQHQQTDEKHTSECLCSSCRTNAHVGALFLSLSAFGENEKKTLALRTLIALLEDLSDPNDDSYGALLS